MKQDDTVMILVKLAPDTILDFCQTCSNLSGYIFTIVENDKSYNAKSLSLLRTIFDKEKVVPLFIGECINAPAKSSTIVNKFSRWNANYRTKIVLPSMFEVSEFTQIANSLNNTITISQDEFVVNAKSTLGILSLDNTSYATLEIKNCMSEEIPPLFNKWIAG